MLIGTRVGSSSHKYTKTVFLKHKCTNTQIHKNTNVQIHKYKYMDRWMLIGTVPAPEWALGSILDARTNTS